MERVKVNEGTKVNLYNLFEDLQDYTKLNSLRILETLIDTFGINVATNIDGSVVSTDSSLQVGAGAGGTGIGGYVTVEAGEALTSNLSWLSVGSSTHAPTQGLSLGAHTLYLAYASTDSDPTNILSGFALGLVGGTTKNTRTHDTYAFVWDTNPTVSGVALATVTVGATSNVITTDLRYTNVLMLKTSVIPPSAFTGNLAGAAGAPVIPKNFRITDIGATQISSAADPGLRGAHPTQGAHDYEMALDISWNWDNVSWSLGGSTNSVLVTLNAGNAVVANELTGYHLWHPTGYDYIILTNTAGTSNLTVTVSPFGTNATNLTDLPEVSYGGVIHCDASAYDILMVPVAPDGISQNMSERYEEHITAPNNGTGGPVILRTKLYPYFGERVLIQIRSIGPLGQASTYTVMPAGSFMSEIFNSPVQYGRPFVVSMPKVSDVGAGFNLVPKGQGFTVNITAPAGAGWLYATDYEIIYSTDSNAVNFDNTSISHAFTGGSRTYDISVPTSVSARVYYVKVRPLIGGGAVSDGLPVSGSDTVTVGSDVQPVSFTHTLPTPNATKSYSGTLKGPYIDTRVVKKPTGDGAMSFGKPGNGFTYETVSYYYWTISGLASPAFSNQVHLGGLPTEVGWGTIYTHSGGLNFAEVYQLFGAGDAGPVGANIPASSVLLTYTSGPQVGQYVTTDIPNKDFVIGWDKASRLLGTLSVNVDFDFKITEVAITYNSIAGWDNTHPVTLPVIRVYNSSSDGEAYGATITLDPTITAPNGGTITAPVSVICSEKTSDLTGVGGTGPGGRTIMVDCYNPQDPFGPSNALGINWGPSGSVVFKYIAWAGK